eukprot:40890-Eustigmatos_ZCMA.PRE.1
MCFRDSFNVGVGGSYTHLGGGAGGAAGSAVVTRDTGVPWGISPDGPAAPPRPPRGPSAPSVRSSPPSTPRNPFGDSYTDLSSVSLSSAPSSNGGITPS